MKKEKIKTAFTALKAFMLGGANHLDCYRLAAVLIILLAGLVVGSLIGYRFGHKRNTNRVERDTVTVRDFVAYYEPMASDSIKVKYVTRYMPIVRHDTIMREKYAQNTRENIPPQALSDERDSAAVVIPITQQRYENDDYRAYVSGYEPSLDSIFVFPKTTVIRERSYKPPNKWHVGISCGYGYGFTSKEREPYIGIGITYSIISFDF